MRITGKGWFLISLGIFGVAAAILLGACSWLFLQLSAEIAPAEMARPSEAEITEARRKLAILEQPAQPQGFVDFTEGEINSLVHDLFFAKKNTDNRKAASAATVSTANTNAWRLKRLRFKLNESSIECYAWVSRSLAGREWNLCWERAVTLGADANQWVIGLQAVRVGARAIPYKFWPSVLTRLGAADLVAMERFEWLRRQPWVELHLDPDKPIPVLRIYNHVPQPATPATKP